MQHGEAILSRHDHVKQNHVERVFAEHLERRVARDALCDPVARRLEKRGNDVEILRIVIDAKNEALRRLVFRVGRAVRLGLRPRKQRSDNSDGKPGAAPLPALDRNIALHRLRKAACNIKPDADAALQARGTRIALLEGREDAVLRRLRHSGAAVGDGDNHFAVVPLGGRRRNLDAADVGELDCV